MNDNIAPIENISPDLLQNLQGVLFDIDDTFTTHGKIPACSLSALWYLKNAGLKLISVTGRPA
ncbi:MAG: HAD family hydrolase, partial [Desulfobacteraceae bacterium]